MNDSIQTVVGDLRSDNQRFAIVVGRFNEFVSSRLLNGCLDALNRHGCREEAVTVVWVPGAWELPLVARRLADRGGCDAIICLGCVLRGDTPHFDYVAGESAKGIAQASMETGVPIIFGVVTGDTLEQAIQRAGAKHGNKGADAAITAIEMANVYKAIDAMK